MSTERNLRKTRVGKVVSDKMDKTVVVAIVDNVKHPLYNRGQLAVAYAGGRGKRYPCCKDSPHV